MSMISLGGSDWLGIGSAVAGAAEGTAMCGARPLSGSTEAYDTCINRSLEVMAADSANKAQAEASQRKTKLIIIGLVSVTVLILGIVLIRARRK